MFGDERCSNFRERREPARRAGMPVQMGQDFKLTTVVAISQPSPSKSPGAGDARNAHVAASSVRFWIPRSGR